VNGKDLAMTAGDNLVADRESRKEDACKLGTIELADKVMVVLERFDHVVQIEECGPVGSRELLPILEFTQHRLQP
jgi:hypothetical protein